MTHPIFKACIPAISFFKKSLPVLLACVLAFGLFPGCSMNPAQNAVHLLVKVPRTSHDVSFDDSISQIHEVLQRMADSFVENYDKVPVDIEIEVFEQNQYDAVIADTLDTDESPDMLYGDYFNISSYIGTGKVVPLDDVVTTEIREDIYPYLFDMSSVDGKVYMMPYLVRQNVLAYNKDLFRQVGLDRYIKDDTIQSWSLDEWTNILDTLADKLPNGSYPMMMYAASSQGDTHTMMLLRSAGSEFFDDNGRFAISDDKGVAALKWIQDGVDKGWFPPHSENLEIEDCSSLFRSGQLAIYMVNNASIGRYGDSIGMVNFPGPDEDGSVSTFVSGFEIFDNGDPQKVAISKDFLSYIYANEELMDYSAGTLPASKRVADKYGDDILSYDLFANNRKNVIDFTGGNIDVRPIREIFYEIIHELLMQNITPEEAAAEIDERCNAALDESAKTSFLHE